MSTEENVQVEEQARGESQDTPMQDATSNDPTSSGPKKRPRLDMTTDSRERKRGKTMFGLVLGTLKKAKNEDKERNASEAAKKRQLIEQRLQDKLRKETDTVRRAEEAKKDKTSANRKEEDLQLKDSIHKLRRTRLPLLANFLSTSDQIPSDDAATIPSTDPLATVPRSHPPPLFYLPAILTPAQESFLKRRKTEVKEAAEREWEEFHKERAHGVEEITRLRQRVAEEEERKKGERQEATATAEEDVKMSDDKDSTPAPEQNKEAVKTEEPPQENGSQMEVDDDSAAPVKEESKPPAPLPESKGAAFAQSAATDEDDAVEY